MNTFSYVFLCIFFLHHSRCVCLCVCVLYINLELDYMDTMLPVVCIVHNLWALCGYHLTFTYPP